jgi:hypothetical protein
MDHITTADAAMPRVASKVLGKRPSHVEVKQMIKDWKDVLDIDGSGSIDQKEAIKAIGEVERRSLLM